MTVLKRLASLLMSTTPGRKRREKEPHHQAQQPISLVADDGSQHTGKRRRSGSGPSAAVPGAAAAANPSQVVDLTGDASPAAAAHQARVSQGSSGGRKGPQATHGAGRATASTGTAAAAQPPAAGAGASDGDPMFSWCSLSIMLRSAPSLIVVHYGQQWRPH